MDTLINQLQNLELTKQTTVQQYIRDDIGAIVTAVKQHPDKVDTALIEFPPLLEHEIDLECLQMAINYLKLKGQDELFNRVSYQERDRAVTYLDYYLDTLEECLDYMKSAL